MRHRREEEWAAIIEAQEKSELTVRRFCQNEGLCEQSLRNHMRKRKDVAIHGADMGWPGFVELQKKPETFFQTRPSVMKPASHLSITIRFGNGVSVEVGEEADRETVRWLCGMIRDIA